MLGNTPRALVVDDEHDVAESFARVLNTMGCEAEFVTDPRLAMETAARFKPQIVFLDLGMPGISGYELAQSLRARYGWHDGIRLVAVTAYGSDDDRALSRTVGFDAHVLKPVSPALVESMLQTLLPKTADAEASRRAPPALRGGIPVANGYALPRSTRLLLAVTPDLRDRFRRVLVRHDVTAVRDSSELRHALKDHSGLVILDVHFDEPQAFSLLADMRAHPNYRRVPILCVLDGRRALGDGVAVEGLEHAVRAMRADAFLALGSLDDDEAEDSRIRRAVDYLILIDRELRHALRSPGEVIVSIERRRHGG